jgi:hypothetical protein
MLREKLFLSIVFLVTSFFANIALLPLLVAFIIDPALSVKIGAGLMLLIPAVSLALLWSINFASVLMLRSRSFFAWGLLLVSLGIIDYGVGIKQDSTISVLVVGLVLLAISFLLFRKQRAMSSTASDKKVVEM